MPRNRRPTPEQIAGSKQLHAAAAVTWPLVFNQQFPVPLAIGVDKQIAAHFVAAPPEVVAAFMHFWTTRLDYLKAVAAHGSRRFNLDGSEAGPVSDEQREDARQRATNVKRILLNRSERQKSMERGMKPTGQQAEPQTAMAVAS